MTGQDYLSSFSKMTTFRLLLVSVGILAAHFAHPPSQLEAGGSLATAVPLAEKDITCLLFPSLFLWAEMNGTRAGELCPQRQGQHWGREKQQDGSQPTPCLGYLPNQVQLQDRERDIRLA